MQRKMCKGNKFWTAFQPDAKISARIFVPGQSIYEIFLRPRDDDVGDPDYPGPDPEPPNNPCAGRPYIYAPLVAAQVDLGFATNTPRHVHRLPIRNGSSLLSAGNFAISFLTLMFGLTADWLMAKVQSRRKEFGKHRAEMIVRSRHAVVFDGLGFSTLILA
jgi:hypothetical protein